MNYHTQNGTAQLTEDLFNWNVQGLGKIYHEVLLTMKILQTKP